MVNVEETLLQSGVLTCTSTTKKKGGLRESKGEKGKARRRGNEERNYFFLSVHSRSLRRGKVEKKDAPCIRSVVLSVCTCFVPLFFGFLSLFVAPFVVEHLWTLFSFFVHVIWSHSKSPLFLPNWLGDIWRSKSERRHQNNW